MPKKNKNDFTPVYAEQNKAEQVKEGLSEGKGTEVSVPLENPKGFSQGSGGEADGKFEPKELDDALDKKKSSKFAGSRSYLFEYNHKIVVITLINGVELQGKLHVGDDNFNVQLELDSKRILVPKHSILFIKLCD